MLYCAPPKASLQKSERRPGRAESSRSCESASSWMKTCTATWSGSLTPRSWMPTARGKVSDRDSSSRRCSDHAEPLLCSPLRAPASHQRRLRHGQPVRPGGQEQDHLLLVSLSLLRSTSALYVLSAGATNDESFFLLLLSLQPFGPSLESFLPDEVLGVRENQGFLLAGDVPCLPQHLDHSNRAPPSV